MTLFIALTFYFGIVKKDLLHHYWSVDSVMSTPFPRSIMSRQEFFNIMSFLHCCDSSDYPGRGQPGYDSQKKNWESVHNITREVLDTATDTATPYY